MFCYVRSTSMHTNILNMQVKHFFFCVTHTLIMNEFGTLVSSLIEDEIIFPIL